MARAVAVAALSRCLNPSRVDLVQNVRENFKKRLTWDLSIGPNLCHLACQERDANHKDVHHLTRVVRLTADGKLILYGGNDNALVALVTSALERTRARCAAC